MAQPGSIQSVPVPTGAKASSFSGVSCSAATACEAVGSYVNSGGTTVTLAESWNGTAWSIQSTPNPTGATSSSLSSVSCISSSACTAVGKSVTTAQSLTGRSLERHELGVTDRPTSPSGAKASVLSRRLLRARPPGSAMAVGYYDNSAGTKVTLALGYYGPFYGWLVISTAESNRRHGQHPVGCLVHLLSQRLHRLRLVYEQHRNLNLGGSVERNELRAPDHPQSGCHAERSHGRLMYRGVRMYRRRLLHQHLEHHRDTCGSVERKQLGGADHTESFDRHGKSPVRGFVHSCDNVHSGGPLHQRCSTDPGRGELRHSNSPPLRRGASRPGRVFPSGA